jgi:hypothetical protein
MRVRDYAAGNTFAWTAMARDVGQDTFAGGSTRRTSFAQSEAALGSPTFTVQARGAGHRGGRPVWRARRSSRVR